MKNKKMLALLCAAAVLFAVIGTAAAETDAPKSYYETAEDAYYCRAYGDVDGDGRVTAADARLAMRQSVGLETLSDRRERAADTDGNGIVNASDARDILRVAVGLDEIPEHTALRSVTVSEATCFEIGISADLCAMCGKLFNFGKIPALTHYAIAWETVEKPTCLKTGLAQQKCVYCDTVLDTKQLEKSAHSFGKVQYESAPSCMLYVNTYRECTLCGTREYSTEAPSGTHSWSWETVRDATCLENGLKKQVCRHCGTENDVTQVIEAPGSHNIPKEWKTSEYATCTKDGLRIKACVRCRQVCESEVIPATGHIQKTGTYEQLSPASCTENGKAQYYCTVCLQTVTEVLPATGHTPVNEPVRIEPTCTVDGSVAYSCKSCGGDITEKIPATGHTPESWNDAEPYSDETGDYLIRRCAVCREEVQRYTIKDNMDE